MKVILCGAAGRMGKNIASLPEAEGNIVCGVDCNPAPCPFPIYKNFSQITETADVVIDFSSPALLPCLTAFCKEKKTGAVLAATGYTKDDELMIEELSKSVPVFRSGNFSIGINLLQYLTEKAAGILNNFDVEIIEKHHNKKKDAPSGTALMLAQSVEKGRGKQSEIVCGREGMVGERGNEIGIHSVRGGTIVGEHEVLFAGEDEMITLSHTAQSRKIFAVGAWKAALWLTAKPSGLYNMTDLLNDITNL